MNHDWCVVVLRHDGSVAKVIGPLKSETARQLANGYRLDVGPGGKKINGDAICIPLEKP